MTRTVRGDDVEVELGDGTITLHWPSVGVTLGPCAALVSTATGTRSSDATSGTWQVETAEVFGRPGNRARWRSAGAPSVSVHVPLAGTAIVVEAGFAPEAQESVGSITPLRGPTDLPVARRLVDGYDSWAYSGVRGSEPGTSFWNTVLVADDGRALAVQALGASRLCTSIAWEAPLLRVDAGATPPLDKVEGTWGYLVGRPSPLDLTVAAGDTSPPSRSRSRPGPTRCSSPKSSPSSPVPR